MRTAPDDLLGIRPLTEPDFKDLFVAPVDRIQTTENVRSGTIARGIVFPEETLRISDLGIDAGFPAGMSVPERLNLGQRIHESLYLELSPVVL